MKEEANFVLFNEEEQRSLILPEQLPMDRVPAMIVELLDASKRYERRAGELQASSINADKGYSHIFEHKARYARVIAKHLGELIEPTIVESATKYLTRFPRKST